MKRFATISCVLILAVPVKAEDKPDPTGTWKYTAEVNGESIEVTIRLKLAADKVKGAVRIADMESKIEEGSFSDGQISFKVKPSFNGRRVTVTYKGTIKGDTFKGRREIDLLGEVNTREFEAKRSKE